MLIPFSRSATCTLFRCILNTPARFYASYPDPGPSPHVPPRPSGVVTSFNLAQPVSPPPDIDDLNLPKLYEFPVAEDPMLHFISSLLMRDGKRKLSDQLVSKLLLNIYGLTRNPPLPILRDAIQKASPAVRNKTTTRGSKKTPYPVALTERQRVHAGFKAMMDASSRRPGRTIAERLAREVVDIVTTDRPDSNPVLKKKYEDHKTVMLARCVACDLSFAPLNVVYRGNLKVR